MFCSRCWTFVGSGASFCGRCGELFVQDADSGRVDIFLTGFDDDAARERFCAFLAGMAQDAPPERLDAFVRRLPAAFMTAAPEEFAKPLLLKLSDLGVRLYVRRTGEAEPEGGEAPAPPRRRRRRVQAAARRLSRLRGAGGRGLYAALLLLTAAIGTFVLYAVSRYESPFEAALREKEARGRTVGTHFPILLRGDPEPLPVEGFLPLPPDAERLRSREMNAEGLKAYAEGRYVEALDRFGDAMRADPSNPVIRRNVVSGLVELARECFERDDLDGAMQHLRRALELDPGRAAAMKWLGAVYYRLDMADRAVEMLSASLAYEPGDAEVHWLLAEISYDRDDVLGAAAHMREYLRLDPGNAEARAHLRKLQDEIRIERNMEELSSDHFKVKFEGAANFESGRLVLESLERAYRKLAQDLDYEPEREVTALLYTDRGFHEVIHAPDWTGAIFDGKIRIPLGGLDLASKSEVESLVLHEYTHAVVHHMTKGNCPAWLNEGLALYQSERDKFNQKAVFRFRIRHRGQDVLALSDMEAGFLGFDRETARAAYNQAFNVVAYLVSVYGYSEVRRLLLAFGAGRTVEEAVLEALGVPYDEFEGAFQRYMFNWEE